MRLLVALQPDAYRRAMTSRIVIVGLGQMGRPIALHLATKRRDEAETIVAIDSDPTRLEGMAAPGLVATTDREAAAGADLLFLCLPDGDVVEAVLFGPDGLAARLSPGATVVDLSTVAHAKAISIGRALERQGRAFLDAPVSGAPAGAVAGTLTVM